MSQKTKLVVPSFTELNKLSSEYLGSKILFATDDWFAPAENLLKQDEPVFKPNIFTDYGKWMDGWETRRKRIPGHDWCIIKLGLPGVIKGLEVDTAFFTGNYAPQISIQAVNLTENVAIPKRSHDMIGTAATPDMFAAIEKLDSKMWTTLLPMTPLKPGFEETRHNFFAIDSNKVWTHVRLNIYPDGGIARLHIFGEAVRMVKTKNEIIDLISVRTGGVCKGYSNAHYGHPRNIIQPSEGINMGDGWETARRLDRPPILEIDERGILKVPGNEWAIFKLCGAGSILHIEVNTKHFKGNFPDSVKIEGAFTDRLGAEDVEKLDWDTILAPSKLSAHRVHTYKGEIKKHGPFTHVKVTITPDGGISRLRIYGMLL